MGSNVTHSFKKSFLVVSLSVEVRRYSTYLKSIHAHYLNQDMIITQIPPVLKDLKISAPFKYIFILIFLYVNQNVLGKKKVSFFFFKTSKFVIALYL